MRRLRPLPALLIAAVTLSGCGGGDERAPRAAAAAEPDLDALLATHDEFVTCVQRQDELGATVQYRDGRAVAETHDGSLGSGSFDDRISAPGTIGSLLERGAASYVGLRSGAGPDVDVLILPSPRDAESAAKRVAAETGRSPRRTGAFVTVPLSGAGEAPDAPAALRRCIDEA